MKKNQKGFSVIEVLVVVIILCLIGGAGWYVYDKQSQKDTPTRNDSSTRDREGADKTGISTYRNDELALTFTYPSRWGTASLKTRNDGDRAVAAGGYTEFDI